MNSITPASQTPKETLLSEYRVPDFLIEKVSLHFELAKEKTIVRSVLTMYRNPEASSDAQCCLDGDNLELKAVELDGQTLNDSDFIRTDKHLILPVVPDRFELTIETIIYPDTNTALEGLYHSGRLLCTQCEAEGFRRITYYPDRPDVMAIFTVSLVADKTTWPIMLSNGNLEEQGQLEDGRHWVRWHDPHPKPCYLFALVAGDLYRKQSQFTTASGRAVTLEIYVDPENKHKCDHALNCLVQAMRWDEQTYGREYDLDVFMIVAVNDFNMGAMENKGLNIFNSACVLASPETATDGDYYTIQSIVGHEYFHNWSGNRVTCRDWFQLSLKEGFTVLRDQQFSGDLNAKAVQRISDVNQLRTMQFAEDAGPMAHPVRPASFIEISNFYTVTIYEKGAEVVGMMKTLVGEQGFRKGTDLYFERHDGQAVTTDDFVAAMEQANEIDLTQFKRWYWQAGTPEIDIKTHYDSQKQEFTLGITQHCPATPGQLKKKPFHIPVVIGLIDQRGHPQKLHFSDQVTAETGDSTVLNITEVNHQFVFIGLETEPVLSVLRGFSAPVKVNFERSHQDLALLMANDTDSFSRWDAGQRWFIDILLHLADQFRAGQELIVPSLLVESCEKLLEQALSSPALIAKQLALPSQNYLASQSKPADVDAIYHARRHLKAELAKRLKPKFIELYQTLNDRQAYRFDADAMARRSLKNSCLDYLIATGESEFIDTAVLQFQQADNMTDSLAALTCLAQVSGKHRDDALADFYQQWQHDKQVVDKWLSLQAQSDAPDTLKKVKALMQHPAFTIKNPNNVRALIGQFCRNNPINFHAIDGSGYDFLSEQILVLDKLNPQIAARQLGAFNSWQQYDKQRQQLMIAALTKIKAQPDLSADVFEIVTKYLAEA